MAAKVQHAVVVGQDMALGALHAFSALDAMAVGQLMTSSASTLGSVATTCRSSWYRFGGVWSCVDAASRSATDFDATQAAGLALGHDPWVGGSKR
jgi:hypothetical protein